MGYGMVNVGETMEDGSYELPVKNAAEKQSLADGDGVVITDSADSSKTKRVLWSTIKSVLGNLFVPITRKVNNKALSKDVTLTGDDIKTSATDETSLSAALSNKVTHLGNITTHNTVLAVAASIPVDSTFFGDPSSSIYNAADKPPNTADVQYFVMLDGTTGRRVVLAFGYGLTDEARYIGTREVLNGEWLNDWIALAAADHTHAANQVQVSGGSSVEEALEAKISHTDEFTAEMQDLHGNARGLLCTVPSYAGPDIASINAPPDVNWGTCLSLQVGSIRTLMLIDSSGLWIQYYNGEGWSAWQKMLSASSPDVVRLGCVSRVGLGAQSAQNPSTVVFGAEPLMWYVVERGALSGRNNYFFHGKVSGSNIWLANDSINTMSMSWSGNTLSYCHNNGSIWDNAGTTYDFYYFYK